MKQGKTNAMRILDKEKIAYTMLTYATDDGKIDGIAVAQKIGREENVVYKTLISQGTSKSYYVFVIPVEAELDLKKAESLHSIIVSGGNIGVQIELTPDSLLRATKGMLADVTDQIV
ncbi:Cys-tRNA(Pro) deacylase [Brevibacillus sp. 179-C9.3 HS]|uniref:Cys-tRNA(Pro) deacylase n=1 Tax=unclassified Brevibacillus TaxID=2684853 RepID=UPI0039A2FE82